MGIPAVRCRWVLGNEKPLGHIGPGAEFYRRFKLWQAFDGLLRFHIYLDRDPLGVKFDPRSQSFQDRDDPEDYNSRDPDHGNNILRPQPFENHGNPEDYNSHDPDHQNDVMHMNLLRSGWRLLCTTSSIARG
jgi:hypothetical protein